MLHVVVSLTPEGGRQCFSANIIFGLVEYIFTESQNHRMVGVGRDLCGSSSPTFDFYRQLIPAFLIL